jgi:hypothetical protein
MRNGNNVGQSFVTSRARSSSHITCAFFFSSSSSRGRGLSVRARHIMSFTRRRYSPLKLPNIVGHRPCHGGGNTVKVMARQSQHLWRGDVERQADDLRRAGPLGAHASYF